MSFAESSSEQQDFEHVSFGPGSTDLGGAGILVKSAGVGLGVDGIVGGGVGGCVGLVAA